MTPRHLDDLFSAAYEDELTPSEDARFQAHIQSCAPCATAYEEFRASIDALREMPRARMPHAVHLPSTPPVAERSARPRIGLSWFNLGLIRRFPATAIAGAAAAVLVIAALAHGSGGSTPVSTAGSAAGSPNAPIATPGSSNADAACSNPVVSIQGGSPPASFTQEDLATDAAQPALHLVLAAPTLVVPAGKPAVVYAELSVPVAGFSIPGATSTAPPARAILPCVSIGVGNEHGTANSLQVTSGGLANPVPAGLGAGATGSQYQVNGAAAGPLLTFQVPAGLAPGTEIHVTATVPAGYAGPGSPPLTAQLTLTTS